MNDFLLERNSTKDKMTETVQMNWVRSTFYEKINWVNINNNVFIDNLQEKNNTELRVLSMGRTEKRTRS